MTDLDVQSPCVKVCAVDAKTGWCIGCGRTLGEIGGWIQLGAAGRSEVLSDLPERLQTLQQNGKRGPIDT